VGLGERFYLLIGGKHRKLPDKKKFSNFVEPWKVLSYCREKETDFRIGDPRRNQPSGIKSCSPKGYLAKRKYRLRCRISGVTRQGGFKWGSDPRGDHDSRDRKTLEDRFDSRPRRLTSKGPDSLSRLIRAKVMKDNFDESSQFFYKKKTN